MWWYCNELNNCTSNPMNDSGNLNSEYWYEPSFNSNTLANTTTLGLTKSVTVTHATGTRPPHQTRRQAGISREHRPCGRPPRLLRRVPEHARPPYPDGTVVRDGGEHLRVSRVPRDAVHSPLVPGESHQRLLAVHVPNIHFEICGKEGKEKKRIVNLNHSIE
jgi:hypothetical protein